MLDIAVAYSRYRFLGNEFLTWLWFTMETDQARLRQYHPDLESLHVGSRMVLENKQNGVKETITIKGDEADMEEGLVALRKGGVVTEMHLAYRSGAQQWQFSLKGESLNISDLKLPETGAQEAPEDLEGIVIERVHLAETVISLVNALFASFVKQRISAAWPNDCVPRIRKWVSSS